MRLRRPFFVKVRWAGAERSRCRPVSASIHSMTACAVLAEEISALLNCINVIVDFAVSVRFNSLDVR